MSDFNWTCPHCERPVTISAGRVTTGLHSLYYDNADGLRALETTFIVCPNPECRHFSLTAGLYESAQASRSVQPMVGKRLISWNLVPPSRAKTFPSYVPQAILDDYREACLIQDLSPKASATLSRRCLQGILRDFWQVKAGRLVDEIDQIKDKVDPETWSAIDAVRTIGNIGAHMEKDISVIVDVDPNEAELLIGLVETLIREWYIAKEERKNRMNAIVTAAAAKKTAPASSSPVSSKTK